MVEINDIERAKTGRLRGLLFLPTNFYRGLRMVARKFGVDLGLMENSEYSFSQLLTPDFRGFHVEAGFRSLEWVSSEPLVFEGGTRGQWLVASYTPSDFLEDKVYLHGDKEIVTVYNRQRTLGHRFTDVTGPNDYLFLGVSRESLNRLTFKD
jgi:hypothetical protein